MGRLYAHSWGQTGMPLSPLLFVIVADILLRRMHKEFRQDHDQAGQHTDVTIQAFADDTAVAIKAANTLAGAVPSV